MRISQLLLLLAVFGWACGTGAAQSLTRGAPAQAQPVVAHGPSAPPAGAVPAVPTEPPPPPPSQILQPSLDQIQQTLSALRLDKWKRGTVRDEANANINDIQHDVQSTLPDMLKDADSAPAALSKVLPISRHISALYEVLLRVEEAARVSAPAEQVTQLEQALVGLGKARSALDARMVDVAAAQEKQVVVLRTTVQAQAAAARAAVAPAPVPACPVPPPAKKVVKKRKPPAATTPQTPPAAKTGTAPAAKTGTTPTAPKTGP